MIIPRSAATDSAYILYDEGVISAPGLDFFDPQRWQQAGTAIGTARGRGTVCIFVHDGGHYALRHYRRGGWAAHLSRDRYFWTGLERTRAWREWRLLASMYMQGLPVPRPVAAHVQRRALTYRADLITALIGGTRPLAELLTHQSLSDQQWCRIGAEIARIHAAGIYHADLNARNILIGEDGRVYFVDFDKSARVAMSAGRRQANINRLQRALDKLAGEVARLHYSLSDRDALLSGYRDNSR